MGIDCGGACPAKSCHRNVGGDRVSFRFRSLGFDCGESSLAEEPAVWLDAELVERIEQAEQVVFLELHAELASARARDGGIDANHVPDTAEFCPCGMNLPLVSARGHKPLHLPASSPSR